MTSFPKLFNIRAILFPKKPQPSDRRKDTSTTSTSSAAAAAPKVVKRRHTDHHAAAPSPIHRKRRRISDFARASPRSNPSPLIRRIPSLLSPNEEYAADPGATTEATPRSKRLRRTSDLSFVQHAQPTPPTPAASMDSTSASPPAAAAADTSTSAIIPAPTPSFTPSPEDEAAELDDLIRHHHFTQQEAHLFLRIQRRGLEPLMPAHWQVDFNTMPDNLFFPAAENAVGHIDSITLSGTFNATCAFQNVVNLGALVRGSLEAGKDCEDRVVQTCRKYIQWSVEDVRTHLPGSPEITPRICLIGSNGGGARACEARMQGRMRRLAAEVREEDRYLEAQGCSRPADASRTVYGVAVSGCVVALVTLDAAREDAEVKTMCLLDWSDRTVDFWNAVSFALLVIAGREDELERNEWYRENDVKRSPVELGLKGKRVRKGWEMRSRAVIDDDVDK